MSNASPTRLAASRPLLATVLAAGVAAAGIFGGFGSPAYAYESAAPTSGEVTVPQVEELSPEVEDADVVSESPDQKPERDIPAEAPETDHPDTGDDEVPNDDWVMRGEFTFSTYEAAPGDTVHVSGVCTLNGYPLEIRVWLDYWEHSYEPQDTIDVDLEVAADGTFETDFTIPAAAYSGKYLAFMLCKVDDAVYGTYDHAFTVLGDNSPQPPKVTPPTTTPPKVTPPTTAPPTTTMRPTEKTSTTTTASPAHPAELARTGSSNMFPVIAGGMLLAAGATLLVRRQRA